MTIQSRQAWGHAILLGGWLLWVLARFLPLPLVVDEVAFADEAMGPFGQFGTIESHPPLYIHLLWLLAHGLHLPPEWLRVAGVVTLLLTAMATFQLAEHLKPGGGPWALWLLLTNPLAIRGALLLDIDNTFLMGWVVGSVWWLTRVRWPLSLQAQMGLGVWWALGLWMKLTTPLLWPLALWLAYAAQGQWRRGIVAVGCISVVGAGIFGVAWALYSRAVGIPWEGAFVGRTLEVLQRGATDPGTGLLSELAERAVRIALWIGPLALGLWCVGSLVGLRAHQAQKPDPVLTVTLSLGWMLLLGYWVVGGVIWSFARYHCPFVPLLAALGGGTVVGLMPQRRIPWWALGGLVSVAALWQIGVVGDLLYLVNRSLRHALIFDPGRLDDRLIELLIRVGGLVGMVGLIGLLLWLWRRRWQLSGAGTVSLALAIGAMGSGVGLTVSQAAAPYSTTYCYGRPWATVRAEVAFLEEFMRSRPTAKALVPWDVYYHAAGLGTAKPFYLPWKGRETPEALTGLLMQVECVLADPDYNNAHFLRTVLPNPQVQRVLAERFESHSLETATAWIRRRQDRQWR